MKSSAEIILKGFNPDPSIIYDGNFFWCTTSTFEYFPGLPLYKSSDGINWSFETYILSSPDNLDLRGAENSKGGIYAPTLRFHNGVYYAVTTNKNIGWNYLVYSTSPYGPWSRPVMIRKNGIDPSLFFDDDGSCFYTSNGVVEGVRGILGAHINPETGEFLEKERILTEGISKVATEAPHIYKKDGWYYLFFAEGGTGMGHHECVMRSRSLYEEWEYMGKPLISNVNRKDYILHATGHMDITEGPDGEWFGVFLGIRIPNKPLLHQLGRESFRVDIKWEKGWPIIEGGMEVDLAPVKPTTRSIDFSRPISEYPFEKLRVPNDSLYVENLEKKTITLVSSDDLSRERGTPTMLLLRQEDLSSIFKAYISLDDLEGRGGIVAWFTNDYYYRIIVEKEGKKTLVFSSLRVHGFEATKESVSLDKIEGNLELSIATTPDSYSFFVDGISLGTASYAGLCPEGAMYMTFTGTMLGIWSEKGHSTFADGLSLVGN
ncbi:MAG: family 43 glycosylhydrolase [Candidatus Ornithospirochaeta sp.]